MTVSTMPCEQLLDALLSPCPACTFHGMSIINEPAGLDHTGKIQPAFAYVACHGCCQVIESVSEQLDARAKAAMSDAPE